MSKLADLDANFVLDVSYKKSNLSRLLAELDGNGVRYEVRPGSNDTNVYVFIRDNGTGVVKEVSKDEIVKGVIPLYGKEETKRLQFIWRSSKNRLFPRASELVELASITGDPRMALYFAFQKSYTKWLVPLAVLGMAFRLFSTGSPWEFNMAYSIAVLAWGIAFSVMWQYTIEPEYSDMFGYRAILPVSDSKSTIVKKLCFIPIAFTFTVCLVAFQFLCFLMEIYITQIYNGPLSMVLALVPTVLISAYVPVLTTVYNVFVNRLVSWENSMMPERSKSRKLFVFSFLTSYAPLLITLFVYLPLGHLLNPQLNLIAKHSKRYNIPVVNDRFVINSDRYRAQFFYFTVTNQVIALALENALPIIMARLPTALGGPSSNTLESRRSLKMASEKYPQDVELLEKVFGYFTGPWGVFNVDDNVRKLVLQFGYIVIFSTIWPLAPLVCIFFNVIMCKLDMWRATKKNRPTWSKDIVYTTSRDLNPITLSPWDSILNFLVWSASLIAPTIVIMYRKCNLPGVGFNFSKAASGEREKWYLESPIKYDWKLIMIYGMLAEHAGMLFRYLLTKLVSAPASTDSAKSPVALKEKQVTEKGGHVNDAFSFHQGVSSPLRINNNEKESCSSDSMYSSTTRHEKEHNSYISTARDYTHGMLASDNKGVDNAIEGIKNNENTTASGVEDTRTLHSPLMVNRPTGADVITESAPNHYNGSGVPGSSPHAPQGGEVPQGGHQNGHHDNQTPNTRHADARPLPLPHQPVKTSLPGMNSNQGQRVASSNNMAPSTAVSSSVAGATLPETIPTSKNYDERQRNLSSPLQNAYSSTRTVTTPTLDPRRQDAPRPSYTIPQPLPRSPDRGEQFIPTAGIHRLNTDHASHPGVTNVSQTSPTITRSPVDNLRGPVEIIGTPMKIVEGGERTDSRIPIAVDESRIPPGSEAKPHNPSTSGGILTLFPNSALSSPAKDATSATSPNGLIVDAPLPSVNGVTQIPVFAVENASSTDAVPNGSTAPVEVNRMAVETSTHHMNGYRMQPEQAQSRELPSDNRSVGARDASVIQGSSNVPANGPTYDHSATLNNGIKTVNRRKSNSIKSFTKLIGSPSKKDHTPSKNKKLKSPLSILKKKFEQ